MPRPEDRGTHKIIFRELAKRPLDVSRMTVTVTHGVVYFHGQVRVAGAQAAHLDIKSEMEMIAKILKQRPGIRDVVNQCTMRT